MSKSESSSVCCTKLQILYYSNICVVEFIVKIRRLHSEVYARVIMIMSSVINIFFFRNIPPGLLEICKVTRKQLQERDAVTRLTNWLAQVARGQVCLTRNKPLTSAPCDWADTRDTLYVACKLMHVTRHTESTWSGRKRQKKITSCQRALLQDDEPKDFYRSPTERVKRSTCECRDVFSTGYSECLVWTVLCRLCISLCLCHFGSGKVPRFSWSRKINGV